MDDSIKQALIDRFRGYLDMVEDGEEPPDDPGETADLFSVLVEMAALRSEVRTESRLVKEALEQFRGVFDSLQASQATLQRELDRARTETRDQAQSALRPLLLDVIDLRDRLVAALTLSAVARPRWHDRLWRRDRSGVAAWQEGLRMTLRRLDQVLLDRRVVATQLAGLPFDPRLARAIGTAADSSVAEGTVIKEVRAGFLWDDQVLRTAEVIVSKGDAGKGDR
ncbi:MAG TPA: nucleotide exchange factor GrpE [Stellaceae bacterium]|nr:nucleotide exchange factor GrpE [Stellaceae bacterium]